MYGDTLYLNASKRPERKILRNARVSVYLKSRAARVWHNLILLNKWESNDRADAICMSRVYKSVPAKLSCDDLTAQSGA